jgi:hypothetical protein
VFRCDLQTGQMMSPIGFKSHRLRKQKSAPEGRSFLFAEMVVLQQVGSLVANCAGRWPRRVSGAKRHRARPPSTVSRKTRTSSSATPITRTHYPNSRLPPLSLAMSINPRSLFAPAAVIVVVSALAGCAPASSSASGGGSSASAAPSAASSAAAAGSSAALTGLPSSCPTAALVSSTLGISTVIRAHSGDSTSLNCTYTGNSLGDSVSINFSTAQQLSPTDAEAQTKAQGFTPAFAKVKGVGDYALYDQVASGGSYIIVSSGPVAFHIVAVGTESKQQLENLAKAIL